MSKLPNRYIFRLYGPGIEAEVEIKSFTDLDIIDIMLSKIRNELRERTETEELEVGKDE